MSEPRLSIDQALQKTVAHHRASELQDAERLYRAILQAQPRHPDANHNLGVLAVGAGQVEAALPLFQIALAANPKVEQFWLSHVDALLQLKRHKPARKAINAARRHGLPVKTIARMKKDLQNAARQALEQTAVGPLQNTEAPRPGREAQEILVSLYQQSRFVEMEAAARAMIRDFPDFAFGWETLAPALKNQRRYAEANAIYREALQRAPDSVMTLANFAACLNDEGLHEEAIIRAKGALAIDENHVGALVNLGNAHNGLEQYDEAMKCYERALSLEPGQVEAIHAASVIFVKRGNFETALSYAERALAIKPDYAEALSNKATILTMLGRIAEARKAVNDALAIAPESPDVLCVLSDLQKAALDSPAFALLERALATAPPLKCKTIHFALGKMYDETGCYREAFAHYRAGNAARRAKAPPHDHEGDAAWLRVARRLFSAETFVRLAGCGSSSRRPIFIVGMPRSGTSLTEQILASHSGVFGAGELDYFSKSFARLGHVKDEVVRIDRNYAITATDIQTITQGYLDFLDSLDITATYVVDKMPHNFEKLGLIALCFPQATILHVERDPVDTCLSCYFQNFSNDRHGYSDDLADLGRHYLYYRETMDYWREVLPVPIQSVRYEQLVGQPESEIPALLAACGLEMEAACLSPHRTERSVRTASKTQVREPIHRASVQKWRRYEQELLPLLAVLREGGVAV